MVGVAGRSKGCHTCRRRKIRCDQRKPACERCERTGRECEGYARGTIFLNQTGFGGVQYRVQHGQVQEEGDARIQIFAATPETYDRVKHYNPSVPSSDIRLASPLLTTPSPLADSNMSLQSTASNRQLDSLCLERICPIPSQQKVFSLAILAPQILASSQQDPVFYHAFNALKLSMPSSGPERPELIVRGRIEYGKALRAMQQAISDDPAYIPDSRLLACTVMKQYELQEISPRTADAFDAHVAGHLQLVKMRGAHSFKKNEFGRAMVREIRYLDILSSLSIHKRGQLVSPEWRCSDIWKDAHDIRLSLLDVAADVGAIFEDFEAIGSESTAEERATITCRASQIPKALSLWHQRLLQVAEFCPPWPDYHNAPDLSQHEDMAAKPSSSFAQIEIDPLEQKYLMLDFWAIFIIANELEEVIHKTWTTSSDSKHKPALPGAERPLESKQVHLAENILTVAAPCIADQCGMWGMLRSMWGLRNAYTALKKFDGSSAQGLTAALESLLGSMAARDFRKAPPLMQAPPRGVIESSYVGTGMLSPISSHGEIELPEILARSTI